MGERHSDGLLPGRRHVHPDDDDSTGRPASARPGDGAGFEERLAVVLLRGVGGPHRVRPDAEQRALAAFRAARDAGDHRARTRRRDDWRPRAPRRVRLSVRATLSVFVASLALGGVAVAAIGSGGPGRSHDSAGGGHEQPPAASAGAPEPEGQRAEDGSGTGAGSEAGTATGSASLRAGHPATAQDTLAHCRAYEKLKGRGPGKALDAPAWQRLVTAAGGENKVAAYCAAQLADHAKGRGTDRDGEPRSGNGGDLGNSGNSRNSGVSDDPGQGADDTGDTGNTGNTGNAGNAGSGGRAAGPGADNAGK